MRVIRCGPGFSSQGAAEPALNAFRERPLELSVIGVNLYPIFTLKRMSRDRFGRLRVRMPYASGALVTKIGEMYFERYGAPIMISETATKGSVRQRQAWLTDSVEAVKTLRAKGVPMVGYTWWPMFALVTWAYRQGLRPLHDHLLQMGLWNLDPDPSGRLDRVETPLVDAYRRLTSGGAARWVRSRQRHGCRSAASTSDRGVKACFRASFSRVSKDRQASTGTASGSIRSSRQVTTPMSTKTMPTSRDWACTPRVRPFVGRSSTAAVDTTSPRSNRS